jgi:hypothetical protein
MTKPKKGPRPASTYRGARRNATRPTGAIMQRRGPEPCFISLAPRHIPLNRSQNWSRATSTFTSYEHARQIGPSAEPVR